MYFHRLIAVGAVRHRVQQLAVVLAAVECVPAPLSVGYVVSVFGVYFLDTGVVVPILIEHIITDIFTRDLPGISVYPFLAVAHKTCKFRAIVVGKYNIVSQGRVGFVTVAVEVGNAVLHGWYYIRCCLLPTELYGVNL